MEFVGNIKRVLILVENLPVPFDRRVWLEARTLKNNGYQVSVICPAMGEFQQREEIIDDIHIYRHPLPEEVSSSLGYIHEYAVALYHEFKLSFKIRRTRGFDIIHMCNPPDLLFLVALWFKIFNGVKVIYDQHDLNPEMYESKFGKRGFFYMLLLLFEKFTFSLADIVISMNESYKSFALNRGGKNESDVFVVRSAPDIEKFKPTEPNPIYNCGKKYLVGYVGVIGEQDGVEYLIDAIDTIVNEKKRDDIYFMIIGDGPAVPDLKKRTSSAALWDYVQFTGRVPDEELLERLSSCDVCVGPDPKTPFNDYSTMNKIVEYMCLGKPVVQFDLTEGRYSAGDASYYAKPNDTNDFAQKIIDLLNDADLRVEMGNKGQLRVKNELAWHHQSPKLLNAYDNLYK